jgi:hypothetical protein
MLHKDEVKQSKNHFDSVKIGQVLVERFRNLYGDVSFCEGGIQ